MMDLLASLQAKLKKEPALQPLFDKATQKASLMSTFLGTCRVAMAEMEMLTVGDEVPQQVLEDLESLINEQVGYVEGGKIAIKKVKSVL